MLRLLTAVGACSKYVASDSWVPSSFQVVHVVDMTGKYGENQEPDSYVSLFSTTPGNLIKEAEQIGKKMLCGKDKLTDFVTFSVKYSCWIDEDAVVGWDKSDVPAIHVEHDMKDENGITEVSLDTKVSTRWTLGINMEEIEDFQLKGIVEVSQGLSLFSSFITLLH